MEHGPGTDWGEDLAVGYKTRTGIVLFIVYGLIYSGFILINTFNPKLMEVVVFSGVNLAVTYGYTLILLAIILGVLYNYLCTKKENELNQKD